MFMSMLLRARARLRLTWGTDLSVGHNFAPFHPPHFCRGQYTLLTILLITYISDKKVLFADKVLKFTGSGKMKRRILLITDFAIYMVDPETDALKRRIALSALEKLCLSELSDNFFAFIIPTEYDILMASTRKTEIVTVLVEAIKSTSDYEVEVIFSNSFEYNASADLVKEVQFEEVEELCGNELRLPPNVMRKRVAYSFRIKGDGLFSGFETQL
ncbi:hypothetical protein TEA_025271 [Camellia sinensis var. sinensis]|uniref:TH1 domain-containing protein n=1 Tax=Camellia sinensis var. sinensis TaxID=542762 RepID=A0A4S4EF36_CAMSN|nr:hypothetical protein TEA_025271 [Camellia sinensis var. sinensis]